MTTSETNPVAGIFDNLDSVWYYPSPELCKRENISPNMLAFCKARATLALIVKRSATGQDFALSEAGLLYLETVLAKGSLKDGTPVSAAFVVLADIDLRSPASVEGCQLFERARDAQSPQWASALSRQIRFLLVDPSGHHHD